MTAFLKLLVVAVSLALDVFAVSVGVGVRGATTAMKVRIALAFALAEIGMNLLGAGLGFVAGRLIGDIAAYLGFGALAFVGLYMIVESVRNLEREPPDLSRGWGLLVASLSISLDSLGIGFSILYIGVPVVLSLATIAAVSVASSTTGLFLGSRLGARIGERAELIGGVLLMLTGLAFAALKALHVG